MRKFQVRAVKNLIKADKKLTSEKKLRGTAKKPIKLSVRWHKLHL